MTQRHILQPFSPESTPGDCQIDTLISNDSSRLKIVFELAAKLDVLVIPAFEPSKARRKDNLWEGTCFEIFLGPSGLPNYWEFNLSPLGNWNVYSFAGYREGMKPDLHFDKLLYEIEILSENKLKLETAIDTKLFKSFSGIDVGLSAVLERSDGVKSYWSMSHPEDIPDFHAREGWLIHFDT